MKKSDLERMTDGMTQGRGEFTATRTNADGTEVERPYNLTGAVNAITGIVEKMDTHNLSVSDLTDDEQQTLDEAQRAIQYYEEHLGELLGKFAGDDGAVEDDSGNTIADLPNPATTPQTTTDLPDSSN